MCLTKNLMFTIILIIFVSHCETKSLLRPQTGIRSDVIVTSGFDNKPKYEANEEEIQEQPGWARRQLIRFGEMTSSIGNKLGGFTSKLTRALDKICEVVKTVIPVIAAVCHVGQFQFCGPINEAPQELADALAPSSIDLSALD